MRKLEGIFVYSVYRYDGSLALPDDVHTMDEAKKYAEEHFDEIEFGDERDEYNDSFLKDDSFREAWIEEEDIPFKSILDGLHNGIIELVEQDEGIMASIGDSSFFFISPNEQVLSLQELHDRHSVIEIAKMIHSVINSEPIKGWGAEDRAEWDYYKCYLSEKAANKA